MAHYGELAQVSDGWLAGHRVATGLPWPHTWKRRKKGAEAEGADDRAATGERSTARSTLRRTAARDPELSYFPAKRRKVAGEKTGKRKREGEPQEADGKRDGKQGGLKRLIRMGEHGVKAIERQVGHQGGQ